MKLGALKVLIVEDNRQVTELLRTILAALDARDVDMAAHPDDAWPLVETRHYDLLIVDRTLCAAMGSTWFGAFASRR